MKKPQVTVPRVRGQSFRRAAAFSVLFSATLLGFSCSGYRCQISEKRANEYPNLLMTRMEVGATYRLQGLYRGAFEVSRLLPMPEDQLEQLGQIYTEEPLDFCMKVLPKCSGKIDRLTRAEDKYREKFDRFGWLDAVVRYLGAVEGSGCPMGEVLVVRVVSGHPVVDK